MSTNTTQSPESIYVANLNAVSNSISYYYLIVTVPIGLIGNLVSLFVYTRPRLNKKTNTGFLFAWLCILNILSILNYAFLTRSRVLFGYTISMPCGVLTYIRRTFFNITSWMQVLISFDRFVSVVFPRNTGLLKKKLILYLIMIGLLVIVLITNLTNIINFTETRVSNNRTTVSCASLVGINIATNFIAILMRIYLPFLLMVTCNWFVIKRLKTSKLRVGVTATPAVVVQNQAHHSTQNPNNQHNLQTRNQQKSKDSKFAVATITIDFVFFLFYTPVGVNLTMGIIDLFSGLFSSNIVIDTQYSFYSNISQLMAFSYHFLGIFIFAGFNKFFRNELLRLLRLNKYENNTTLNGPTRSVIVRNLKYGIPPSVHN